MGEHLRIAFALGHMVATHVHGIRINGNEAETIDRYLAVLRDVANGTLTLFEGQAEIAARFPIPQDLAERDPAAAERFRAQRDALLAAAAGPTIQNQRLVAGEILAAFARVMPPEQGRQ